MIFANPFARFDYTVRIDPEGFHMPYEIYSDTDLEVMQWKYHRLSNKPKTLLSVRCNGLIYGGVPRK